MSDERQTGATDAQIEAAVDAKCRSELSMILSERINPETAQRVRDNIRLFFGRSAPYLVPPDYRIVPVSALPDAVTRAAMRDAARLAREAGEGGSKRWLDVADTLFAWLAATEDNDGNGER